MRVIVQRVSFARVEVEGKEVGAIGKGMLVLVGLEQADSEEDLKWISAKLTKLRIFDDECGVMNKNVTDAGGEILAVSQFTLFASVKKGNRPSWSRAAAPDISKPLFNRFIEILEADFGHQVPTGVFGAEMKVSLENNGPVTLFIDSKSPE